MLAERIAGLAVVSPLGPARGAGASPGLRYRVPTISYGAAGVGPALASLSLRAFGFHRQTSARAMIDDYHACRRPWGFDPAAVRVPVTLWHGGADRIVPLRHAMTLAAVIPFCTTCVEAGGGHFFYSRRLSEIIGALLPPPPIEACWPELERAA